MQSGGPDLWIVPAYKDLPEQPHPPTPPGPTAPAWGHLLDFLGQILTTARKWNDNASVRLPGVRERVVNIYLDPQQYKVRIPVNVTTDSGNVTGNSGERDRWVGVAQFNFMPSCFFG